MLTGFGIIDDQNTSVAFSWAGSISAKGRRYWRPAGCRGGVTIKGLEFWGPVGGMGEEKLRTSTEQYYYIMNSLRGGSFLYQYFLSSLTFIFRVMAVSDYF